MRHLQKYKDVTQDKLIAGSQVSFWLSSLDTRHHTDFLLGFGSSPQESQGFAACCRLFAIHTIAKEAAVKLWKILNHHTHSIFIQIYLQTERCTEMLFVYAGSGSGSARERHFHTPMRAQEAGETVWHMPWMSSFQWNEWAAVFGMVIQCFITNMVWLLFHLFTIWCMSRRLSLKIPQSDCDHLTWK